MNKIFENKYLIILCILTLAAVCVFAGHYHEILLDFGREVYYPERILEGKVLYRDLFNIYGPFSYLWNALLYKVFGVSLLTLYGAGAVCSVLAVCGVYFIARKYLSDILSFALGVFTIASGVCAVNLFSYTFPYSWGMMYGLVAFLYSFLFLIKYVKEGENSVFLYLSAFLGGLAAASKYDFILYLVLIIFAASRGKDWKQILKTIGAMLAVPVFCTGILFVQGMRISDFANYLLTVKKMAGSETLRYFYMTQGVYFNKNAIAVWVISLIKTGLTLGGVIWGASLFEKRKILSETIVALSICLGFSFMSPASFSFFVILTAGLLMFRLKDFNLLILGAGAVLVSIKAFWGLSYMNYGNYYLPVVLAAFFALLFSFVPKNFQKITAFYVFVIAFAVFYGNVQALKPLEYKISTPKGTIFTNKNLSESVNALIGYADKKFAKGADFVIFPEGLIVNFLADRESEDFYNSMLPLYVETFGEENIVAYLRRNKPDYIIFNNKNMKDYYFEYICKDYALGICGFVQENYSQEKSIVNGNNFLIFKKN